MVKEIVVIEAGGIPLYHYSVTGERRLDELVTGYLSAMGAFAEEVGGETFRVIAFEENKFVWLKKGNLFFIALISEEDSAEIYRVILQNLSEQFVGMFYEELTKEWQDIRIFRSFTENVELTLQRFDGVPGLARRYNTALLPVDDINALKQTLVKIEEDPDIYRGAAITTDRFVIVSTLRTYELEAMLDLMDSPEKESDREGPGFLLIHTSLDPATSFYVVPIEDKGISVFVANRGLTNDMYFSKVRPFVKTLEITSLDQMKRVFPKRREEVLSFYDYDLVVPLSPIEEILDGARAKLPGMTEDSFGKALEIIRTLKRDMTVLEVQEEVRLPRETIDEILAFLIARGMVVISKIFPVMDDRDERFAAYLEVIGIPKKDYDIVDLIWEHCNGSLSIKEISEVSRAPAFRIVEVLRKLGNHVKWERERVLSRVG
ncbi:MAG: hypothetical protein JSW61_07785 [Candidatus Thorarchaeota archaeon]|nr:MAG: hypothetical protein JSW61_07785 [Candidatus Thorarchaeota archaeon]